MATRRRKEDALQTGDVIGVHEEAATITPAAETVTICLNYPHDVKYMVPDNSGRMQPITIKGNAGYLKGKDRGVIPVGAYGITTNVPEVAWKWIKEHRPDDELIRQGLMFASTDARSEAKEREGLRHGFEPVNPNKTANSRPYGN